ncbi:hypothetical protein ACS0TY_020927 [Phlomoides rotata]
MMKQIVLRSNSSVVVRRQPLLENSDYASMHSVRRVSMAEVAGGTSADCVAVCCCCPCGLVNLFMLAVYKVPAGLCWKALRRKHHRRLMKKGGLQPWRCGYDEEFFELHLVVSHVSMVSVLESLLKDREVIELEKEMWDKFYDAGFWRSPSQRKRMDLDSNPDKINPLVPVDLVIDHSVQVDVARSENAVQANMDLEFKRNKERFAFLKWGSTAFRYLNILY